MVRKVIIQNEAIDVAACINEFGNTHEGATVTFTGRARNESGGKNIDYCYYEIYNGMALKEMEKIASEVVNKWSVTSYLIVHRYGTILIGEPSIFIAVSSPHYEESFSSLHYIINEMKCRVPIWKKEYFSDGSEWIV